MINQLMRGTVCSDLCFESANDTAADTFHVVKCGLTVADLAMPLMKKMSAVWAKTRL